VLLLESLLALIAHARRSTTKLDGSPVVVPWLNLRVQLWLRELKRMVASVEATPQLRHSDDLAGSDSSIHLPVVHCRDCGATAWTSTALNSTPLCQERSPPCSTDPPGGYPNHHETDL
jgi:DEAD/DEAH box helicase domain-containing protein